MQALDILASEYGMLALGLAFAIMLFAGFTKGAVGFALPMISISGIGSFLPAEVAIAALILPSLVTNIWQSLRNGVGEAWETIRKYWRLNAVLLVSIYGFAQLVTYVPDRILFITLGIGVSAFTAIQISGWIPHITPRAAKRIEPAVGLVSGFFGGFSGVWGPPIIVFLLSQHIPKREIVRAQGISFMVGSIVLSGAHVQSGLLGPVTLPLSAWMVIPAVIGMGVGTRVQDRLDQEKFRKLTLLVLMLAGLNLMRRGLFG